MESSERVLINPFDKIINQINEAACDIQRERGTLFERLVVAYLKNEPTYKHLYTNVWMLDEVPTEYGIPKKDTGVDIVARQKNGDLVAVQAKFYIHKIGKDEINSFVAELGKSYYQRGLIVSTVDDWSSNALATVWANEKGIEVIGLSDLRNSQIDWSQFSFERLQNVKVKSKKTLRPYQQIALENATTYFKDHDRGQLIMAPGTGKTFTSLKIAETLSKKSNKQYKVLYLVPSIQLLTQTLRSWNNDTELSITSMAVTSDRNASRGDDGTEDIKATDIGYPATTSTIKLLEHWSDIQKQSEQDDLLVVFSTYQSIDVVGNAQKKGFPKFDLIIADEAHRTTGAHEANKEDSIFSKVHSNTNVKGLKRLYQTATPKIYSDSSKKNAKEKSIVISSMDDEKKYGEVFYRMGFGTAVSYGILTDYKVMVLAIDEAAIQKDMQRTLSDPENGLNIDDVGRIVGIWNGMMRRNGYKNPVKNSAYDGAPLERAIAFTRTIADSQKVSQKFEKVVNEYLEDKEEDDRVRLSMRHADGSMNALQKGEILDWLADPSKPSDEARIVSNVRFLTEGIDIPTLDAVIFLAPKKSQVDIVQAVGRIMRKSEGKDYGYIILPIVIPANETPETILDNNKNYETVWQVINALRSVDERFEAMVDKINIAKPKQLKVIGVGSAPSEVNEHEHSTSSDEPVNVQTRLNFEWDKFESAIYGKIVQKVGNRKYLENWSKDVAKIAQRQIGWIKTKLADKKDPVSIEFKKFVASLRHNINSSIDEDQAAEMLSQHLITKPIFEALFDRYSFVNQNPVSKAMETIVRELEKAGFAKEQENLEPLYESVRMRAEGVEKSEDKQKIIVTLYNKFFKTAFKSTTERLGIVFTPIEVVDFIVRSVDDVLKKHFGKSLASEGVHILDPFTGTGTFIVRTLIYLKKQMDAGEITLADITRKYTQELHANEIVLLSYYIAAINIEATFDDINGDEQGYVPFEGIVLTDTFESTEKEDTLNDTYFTTNDKRLKHQKEVPITAIIGNPPYSMGQIDENDSVSVVSYPRLTKAITNSYVKMTNARRVVSVYDSYLKAFKWATVRLAGKGVIAFITNSSFVDFRTMNGVRRSFENEFNYVYVLNLRGAIKERVGDEARKEGQNVFDITTGVAITILIKDGSDKHEIKYHDIGDYLSRSQKFGYLTKTKSIKNVGWENINSDKNGDWINKRDEAYGKYVLTGNDTSSNERDVIFNDSAIGVTTSRDSWVYGFEKAKVKENVNKYITNYNFERNRLINVSDPEEKIKQLNPDPTFMNWSRKIKNKITSNRLISFDKLKIVKSSYRPYTYKWLYYDTDIVEMPGRFKDFFGNNNKVIYVTGPGVKREFSTIVTDSVPEYKYLEKGRGFYLWNNSNNQLFDSEYNVVGHFGLSPEDTFYYVYGVLHSPEYRQKYANDLQKALPRIPQLKNKEQFVEIGRKLANLHLNYESAPAYDGVTVTIKSDNPDYKVKKMKHPKVRDEHGKSVDDKTKIIYNTDITMSDIPEKAYDYVVNGRPAIEWIIDQYRIKTDKKSGITDDPNEFSDDPKYILNLLLSIITVSMKTLDFIDQLPKFEVEE